MKTTHSRIARVLKSLNQMWATEECLSSTLKKIAAIFMLAAVFASNPATGSTWKEEVLLHDGQKIIVERSQTYRGRSEPGQSAPIGEHRISFQIPGSTRTTVWTSEYAEDVGRMNFTLVAVHILNGTPYVVASPNLCLAYNKWGRPNPPYVVFKYDNNNWQRIAFEALPMEFKSVNVVVGPSQLEADELRAMGIVLADKVNELNRGTERTEAKSMVRKPIPVSDVNSMAYCEEMVRTSKGNWLGIDWFSQRPNRAACLKVCDQNSVGEACPCDRLFKDR